MILLVDMLCQMLGGIYAAVLTTRAAEREHQRREASLQITTHMGIGQLIDTVKECQYLTIIFKETDDRLVKPSEFLVRLIASGVVGAPTVKHISTPIA